MTRPRRSSRPARLAALALAAMTVALASTVLEDAAAYATALSCLAALGALVAAVQVDHDDIVGWSTALVVSGVAALHQVARAAAWLPGSTHDGVDPAAIVVLALAAVVAAAWVWRRTVSVAAHAPAESVGFGPCPPA